MADYPSAFRHVLIRDVKHIYREGLSHDVEAAAIPALAELGEALCPTPSEGEADYYEQVVQALLHKTIDRVKGDGKVNGEKRREGLKTLLGLKVFDGGDLTGRRHNAAPFLGFKDGDSLRKAERGGRMVVELLIEEVAEHLAALADEHGFFYSALLSYSTFYPDRPVYDYDSLSYSYGRYGTTDGGPVFNSFINTPSYGDERTFFDGRRSDLPLIETYDPVGDVTKGSKVVILRMYVDNMAYVHPDRPYKSTAHGARVKVRLPTATDSKLRVRGYILADNAEGVEDTVDLIGGEPFALTYMPGSAKLLRPPHFAYPLSDSIVGDEGALIGHAVMDGVFPAGNQFEYAAFVALKVNVVLPSHTSAHSVRPKARLILHETERYEIITV